MASQTLAVVQTISVPSGNPEYEATRNKLLSEFAASIPKELRLPRSTVESVPKNVTNIPRECGLLADQELDITENYDATSLAEAIASRKLTAVAVATAYAKRAVIAHQLTSCLTEWFMDDAVERAKELDDHLASTGSTVGPLHGVPISVKCHFPVAGHWSGVGYLHTRRKDDNDCQMIAILRRAGAVFYCKTNQPQALMQLESTSPLGRTLNPYNINLSAGGTSGGEAALIALRGSVLGVGTDIGGSIRVPAAFCGIYGYKATSAMLPMKDAIAGGALAELNILISTGPMGRSLRDLDLFVSVVTSAKPYLEDPQLIPIPWTGCTGPPSPRPLKIGFMMDDGVIIPQPPVIRALEWARSRLEQDPGFTVRSFEPYGVSQAMLNIRVAYWPDGGRQPRELLAAGHEPVFPLTDWTLRDALQGLGSSPTDVHQQRINRDDFRCRFAKHWEWQDVDLVICPAFVGPASSHDTAWYWNYSAFWNYVDQPAVVYPTPVRAGRKGTEEYTSMKPLSEACQEVRKLWDEGDFEGAPISLQIVARRYHDNELFRGVASLKGVLGLD